MFTLLKIKKTDLTVAKLLRRKTELENWNLYMRELKNKSKKNIDSVIYMLRTYPMESMKKLLENFLKNMVKLDHAKQLEKNSTLPI